jgi:hypothetical protein
MTTSPANSQGAATGEMFSLVEALVNKHLSVRHLNRPAQRLFLEFLVDRHTALLDSFAREALRYFNPLDHWALYAQVAELYRLERNTYDGSRYGPLLPTPALVNAALSLNVRHIPFIVPTELAAPVLNAFASADDGTGLLISALLTLQSQRRERETVGDFLDAYMAATSAVRA